MKVVCKFNNIHDLTDEYSKKRISKYIHLSDGSTYLELSKTYVVHGIVFLDNAPWYYLCEEDNDDYPKPFPFELFDVVDNKMPSFWKIGCTYSEERGAISYISFPEWIDNSKFLENLIDGESKEVAIFESYKKLAES
jgi:hypothetical protein